MSQRRPFELKCFKEPIKVSRKQLYQLYTRPLKQKHSSSEKCSTPSKPYKNIDANLVNHELNFIDAHINNDDQPRQLIPIPADAHSSSNTITYPLPSNDNHIVDKTDIAIQTHDIKPCNTEKPTQPKKSRSKRRKLSKAESEQLVQDSLATFHRVHHLLSNPFFVDNKIYENVEQPSKMKTELPSMINVDNSTQPSQNWSLQYQPINDHNFEEKNQSPTPTRKRKKSKQVFNVYVGANQTTYNKALKYNMQNAQNTKNVNWNALRRQFSKYNAKRSKNLQVYQSFKEQQKLHRLRSSQRDAEKQHSQKQRKQKSNARQTGTGKNFIRQNKQQLAAMSHQKKTKPRKKRSTPSLTSNVPTFTVQSSVSFQSLDPSHPGSIVSSISTNKMVTEINNNSAELSNIRIKILQNIRKELNQHWTNSQRDIHQIDAKYNKIQREYKYLLRQFVIGNNPKLLQMLSSSASNRKHGKIQIEQFQNEQQFKLTILNDLLFKLTLQRIFMRWKCHTYIAYLRWKLINHKLTRRCHISTRKSIFNAWNAYTNKSRTKHRKSAQFQLKQHQKRLRNAFGVWIDCTRKIMHCEQNAVEFMQQQQLKLKYQMYEYWKYCYVQNQLKYYVRGCALRLYLRHCFQRWYKNVRKQKLITRNLNSAQNIATAQSAIVQHQSLRFQSDVLHSWNAQIQQTKKSIGLQIQHATYPIHCVQAILQNPRKPELNQTIHGHTSKQQHNGHMNKEQALEQLAISLSNKKTLKSALKQWINAAKIRKLQKYANHTLIVSTMRTALLRWNTVSNHYYQSISIAIVRGDVLRQKRVFLQWRQHKDCIKRVCMKIEISYKPLAMQKRFFVKWLQWIPQHRRFLLRLHKFECRQQRELKCKYFHEMLYRYRKRQKMEQYMLQFEIRRLYKYRRSYFKIWKRKLQNRLLLRRVFNQTQSLWNYHRNHMNQMRRKEKADAIRKWRVYTMRRKAFRNYKLQSVMADIHRNIALQTLYYRRWRDLFQMLTNYRLKKQQKMEKYETKLPAKMRRKQKRKQSVVAEHAQSKDYYIVPDSVIQQVEKQSGSKPRKSAKRVKKSKPKKSKSDRNCHSLPKLHQAMFNHKYPSSSHSVKSNPIKSASRLNVEELPEQKANEEEDCSDTVMTVNDILLASALPHQPQSTTSIATSVLARDLNRDDVPIEIYYFARKWRYYKPLKRVFFVWKYVTLHPQKLRHCATQKTIDRLETRSKSNQQKVNALCTDKVRRKRKKHSKSKQKHHRNVKPKVRSKRKQCTAK